MAHEYHVRFADLARYAADLATVHATVRALPTFIKRVGDDEHWLRDPASPSPWAYDARLFVRPDELWIELTTASPAVVADLHRLAGSLNTITPAEIVDDDDTPIAW